MYGHATAVPALGFGNRDFCKKFVRAFLKELLEKRSNNMFTGTGTARVTPFRADGALDEPTLRALVKRQIAAGVDFLVPCGTTGESPTLTHEEHIQVVETTVGLAKGKVP